MALHSHHLQGREKGRVSSHFLLLLWDGAICIQVCGSQGTVHSKNKKKEVVSIVNNWKESAVTEMETNPGLFAEFGFFVFCSFIFFPVAAALILQIFFFLLLFLINSLSCLTWPLRFSLCFYLVVLMRKSTCVHIIQLYSSTRYTSPHVCTLVPPVT